MKNKITAVFGKKGYGKTYLVKNTLLPETDRKIILDKNNEYFGGTIFTDYSVFSSCYELFDRRENFTIILKFLRASYYDEFFANILRLRNVCLVIDEANFFFPSIGTSEHVRNMIAVSRHLGISIIYISRRVYEVSPMLRSQTDEIYTFKQTEIRDLDALRSYGFEPGEISNLEHRQYKYINLE